MLCEPRGGYNHLHSIFRNCALCYFSRSTLPPPPPPGMTMTTLHFIFIDLDFSKLSLDSFLPGKIAGSFNFCCGSQSLIAPCCATGPWWFLCGYPAYLFALRTFLSLLVFRFEGRTMPVSSEYFSLHYTFPEGRQTFRFRQNLSYCIIVQHLR